MHFSLIHIYIWPKIVIRLSTDVAGELQIRELLSMAENLHVPVSLLILLSLWIAMTPAMSENNTKQSIKYGPWLGPATN